jgi:hypothetical protein
MKNWLRESLDRAKRNVDKWPTWKRELEDAIKKAQKEDREG